MIIGIAGKINSGKDTVAKLIQYITYSKLLDSYAKLSIDSYYLYHSKKLDSNWTIVRFATKLKQLVSLLTGCSVEDLNCNKFKEKTIGDNWVVYYAVDLITNIKLSPIFASYKDAAKYLISENVKVVEHNYTYRDLLQLIGTEAGRNIIHPHIWINSLMADYVPVVSDCDINPKWDKNGVGLCMCNINRPKSWGTLCEKTAYPNWLVCDTRFHNEMDAIKHKDGILLKINSIRADASTHLSEIEIDTYKKYDYIIDNNDTLEILMENVYNFMLKFNLL